MMHSGTELELVSSSVTYVDSENNDPDYDVTSTTSSLESDDSSSTFNSFQHASRSPTPPSKRTSFLFATTKRMSFSFSPLNRSIASSSNNKVPSSPARSNKDVDEKRMLLELEAQEIERTQFVYLGKPTKSGQPVVYVVLHRLSLSYLRKPEAIALCIDKLFGTTAAATAATINNNNNNYNSNNFNNNNNNTSSHTSRTVSASGSPLGSTSSASPRQWSFPFASTSNNNNSSAQLEAPLKDLVNKQYVLVVDMSNCCGSAGEEEYYAALRDAVTTLAQRVSKSYYEKVSQVWVVQAPNRRLLKAVTSVIELATYNTKVNLAHTWSALGDILDMRDIMIPYVSKLCIPVTYRVIKADGFGRKQPRCLKLTNDSLLEIDEEGEVVNEIPLQLVEEIVSNSASDTEFLITTIAQQQNSAIPIITTLISSSGGSSGTASKSKGKAKNTTTNNNNGDLLDSATLEINPDERPSSPSHHFTCASAFEKEILVSALFEAAVKAGAMSQLQTFKGVKRIRITTSSNKSNNNNNNNTATIASAIKALSSPSSSSPTKAAASGKQQQRRGSLSSQATTTTTTTDDLIYTVKLTHDSIFLLVSDPPGVNSSGILSCQKEIPYSMIQCWFLTGSNNSHVLISYYSKGTDKIIIFETPIADILTESLRASVARFKARLNFEISLFRITEPDDIMDRFYRDVWDYYRHRHRHRHHHSHNHNHHNVDSHTLALAPYQFVQVFSTKFRKLLCLLGNSDSKSYNNSINASIVTSKLRDRLMGIVAVEDAADHRLDPLSMSSLVINEEDLVPSTTSTPRSSSSSSSSSTRSKFKTNLSIIIPESSCSSSSSNNNNNNDNSNRNDDIAEIFEAAHAHYICNKLDEDRDDRIDFADLIQGWFNSKRLAHVCEKKKQQQHQKQPGTPTMTTTTGAAAAICTTTTTTATTTNNNKKKSATTTKTRFF